MNDLILVPETNDILKRATVPFDFRNPPIDPRVLSDQLHECMVKNKGLGLSAPQVGLQYKVFAIHVSDTDPFVMFNPKIVNVSEKEIGMKEGCLSFPLLFMNVKRPDSVRIRYQNFEGEVETKQFIGMTARIVLHEMDHMDGITFLNRASSFELQRATRKRGILKRKTTAKQKTAN